MFDFAKILQGSTGRSYTNKPNPTSLPDLPAEIWLQTAGYLLGDSLARVTGQGELPKSLRENPESFKLKAHVLADKEFHLAAASLRALALTSRDLHHIAQEQLF